MAVTAPFRFAPINRRVWFPSWGRLVTHDVPFKDGMSGEIPIEITAETPLLVGGPRRKPGQNNQPGEVWPVETIDRDANRRYAIPGASLQGLVRSILEIAAFGRLGPYVEDRRFGIRDISDTDTAREYYRNRMINRIKSGWLTKTGKGRVIVPCGLARIDFKELCRLKGEPAPTGSHILLSRSDVWSADPTERARSRYGWFLSPGNQYDDLNRKLFLEPRTPHPRAFVQGKGNAIDGTIVLTGKPNSGTGPRLKSLEFVFHSPNRPGALAQAELSTTREVGDDVWDDFELIHFAQPGRPENPNWTFWKDEYEAGRPVPVFYLEEGGRIATLGTAFMFKAAFRLSAHDMLRNSTPDHAPSEARPRETDRELDLPSLIFGQVANRDSVGAQAAPPGLKRRASFDPALADAETGQPLDFGDAILLGPKPSYYPIYVRQPTGTGDGQLPRGEMYAVYQQSTRRSEKPERARPELAGVKIWPARGQAAKPIIPQELRNKTNVQTRLRPVSAGTRFRSVLRFHNLRAAELGAVLWALSFGDAEAWTPGGAPTLRHRLGMGKPFGLGEITIRIDWAHAGLRLNDAAATAPAAQDCVARFRAEAEKFAAAEHGAWAESVQVQTLLTAADPTQGKPAELATMRLIPPKVNQFQDEKGKGNLLPYLVTGREFVRQSEAAAPSQSPIPGPRPGTSTSRRSQPSEPQPAPLPRLREGDEVRHPQHGVVVVDYQRGQSVWVYVGDDENSIEVLRSELSPL